MRSKAEDDPIVPTPHRRTDPGLTADQRTVLAFLRADISARIRPVVPHLPETDAERLTNAEVAGRLSISAHTARRHTERVLAALGVSSRNDVGNALVGEPAD